MCVFRLIEVEFAFRFGGMGFFQFFVPFASSGRTFVFNFFIVLFINREFDTYFIERHFIYEISYEF